MRVALLSASAGIGGSETSLLELVRGLARQPGIEAVVIVPRGGPLVERVRAVGARTHVLPMPDALISFGEWSMRSVAAMGRNTAILARALAGARTYTRDLAAVLAELQPDIVHTNGFKMHVAAARAAAPGVPIVWHVHEYVSPRPLSRLLLRHHVGRVAAIVANSRSVGADVRAAVGASAPVATIYNAVDLEEFSGRGGVADLDALAGLRAAPPGTCRVGLLATFARWKGHDVFLRAVQQSAAPVRAYVIGAPMYDTAGSQLTVEGLRARAAALGIADRVGFTGFVERPAPLLRALDVVVHASTEPEPFGLVVAEGMACGRAVVVSRAGGAAEIIEEEVDALATTPGDAAALAGAMARLAGDAGLRARLGAAARRAAERRFDPGSFLASFLALYTKLTRGAAVPA